MIALARYRGEGFDFDVNVGRLCFAVWFDPSARWRGTRCNRRLYVGVWRRP